nr:truncated core antigen precursor [Hepatitis B virus]
MQLFHLCLIIF